MENASKALIMAGAVLIALMVIGVARFMFLQISDLEQTRIEAKEDSNVLDYLEAFEQFNKNHLYGSELLSLANLQDDYNRTQADVNGYSRITIKVTIVTAIPREGSRGYYLTTGEKDISEIVNGLTKISRGITSTSSLESDIDNLANTQYGRTGRTIKYLSQIDARQLASILGVTFDTRDDEYAILESIENSYGDLMNQINQYELLSSSYTQFKTTQFELLSISYDNLGHINRMVFKELDPTRI